MQLFSVDDALFQKKEKRNNKKRNRQRDRQGTQSTQYHMKTSEEHEESTSSLHLEEKGSLNESKQYNFECLIQALETERTVKQQKSDKHSTLQIT